MCRDDSVDITRGCLPCACYERALLEGRTICGGGQMAVTGQWYKSIGSQVGQCDLSAWLWQAETLSALGMACLHRLVLGHQAQSHSVFAAFWAQL